VLGGPVKRTRRPFAPAVRMTSQLAVDFDQEIERTIETETGNQFDRHVCQGLLLAVAVLRLIDPDKAIPSLAERDGTSLSGISARHRPLCGTVAILRDRRIFDRSLPVETLLCEAVDPDQLFELGTRDMEISNDLLVREPDRSSEGGLDRKVETAVRAAVKNSATQDGCCGSVLEIICRHRD
jgi:hypothetical protein